MPGGRHIDFFAVSQGIMSSPFVATLLAGHETLRGADWMKNLLLYRVLAA